MDEAIKPTEEQPSPANPNNDTSSHANSEDNVKHAPDSICEDQSPSSPVADQTKQLSGDRKESLISKSINASTSRKESRGIRTYTRLTQLHCDIIGKDFWLEHPYILVKAKI